jgi:hypothetical protein
VYNEAHAFIVEEAVKYGVEKAVLLQHIRFWCVQNEGKDTHEHDGLVYMYQSAQDMHKHYPYWSRQKISRLLRDMEAEGLIKSGNFNKVQYDQTKWYTITLECSDLNNRISKLEQPIPDTKQDTKTDTMFEECWKLYGRKGTKRQAFRYWQRLSNDDKLAILKAIPRYCDNTNYDYRKFFEGWINPTNRMWENEIVAKQSIKRMSI